MYLYYKQPIYVPNIYPSVRDRLQPLLEDRERQFVKDLSKTMRELNRQLAALQNISSGKKAVRSYLWNVFLMVLLFVGILIGLYRTEAMPYLQMIKGGAGWVVDRLKALWPFKGKTAS
jgi:hypothetical protein